MKCPRINEIYRGHKFTFHATYFRFKNRRLLQTCYQEKYVVQNKISNIAINCIGFTNNIKLLLITQ